MATTTITSKQTPRWRRTNPYLWIAPAFLLFGLFTLLPLAIGLAIGFFSWNGFQAARWVGFDNFTRVFHDQGFWQSLEHNVIYAVTTVVGKLLLAVCLAVLLNRSLRGQTFFRTILFMPVVMSFVVVGLIWNWIYNYNFGLLNTVLGWVGLGGWKQDWLGNTSFALGALIVVDIWKWFGFHMVIYLAGLQSIPNELYESARIDGATSRQSFRHITLPLLMPVTMINLLLATAGAFTVFDLVYVMTDGGPVNATDVAMVHIYTQAFQFNQFGYAAAMSYILLVLISVVSLVLMRLLRQERYF
ncbi:MAG TPA: sugar ABC transporter permease [Chloroflexota bacterium]|jgi:ABC-type sugar transport system permease subunit